MCDQAIKSVKLDENYTKGGVERVTKKKKKHCVIVYYEARPKYSYEVLLNSAIKKFQVEY